MYKVYYKNITYNLYLQSTRNIKKRLQALEEEKVNLKKFKKRLKLHYVMNKWKEN